MLHTTWHEDVDGVMWYGDRDTIWRYRQFDISTTNASPTLPVGIDLRTKATKDCVSVHILEGLGANTHPRREVERGCHTFTDPCGFEWPLAGPGSAYLRLPAAGPPGHAVFLAACLRAILWKNNKWSRRIVEKEGPTILKTYHQME